MVTIDRIRAFVSHEDRYVRHAAIDYLADAHVQDESIVPELLQLCDRHGEDLHILAASRQFAVGGIGLPLLLDRLATVETDEAHAHLSWAVAQAPLRVVAEHGEAIAAAEIHEDASRYLDHRRKVAGWSADALWQELRQFASRSRRVQYTDQIDLGYAQSLVMALAAYDVPDTRTFCELLAVDGSETDGGWLEIFLVDLAGHRRLSAAIPALVDKLRIDTDYLLERTVRALARIADPYAVELIASCFAHEDWNFRNYAVSVFGDIKCPESEAAIIRLLDSETDIETRTLLCLNLCQLFSQPGIDVVRRQIEAGYDETLVELDEELLPVCTVLGVELPEAERWRTLRSDREAARQRHRVDLESLVRGLDASRQRFDVAVNRDLDPAILATAVRPRTEPRVGRNDPCPCGSRRKYKKCCGREG